MGIVLTRKAGGLAKNRVRVCAQELMLAFPQHCIVNHAGGSTVFSWELTLSNTARFHSRQMILRVKSGLNERRGWERNRGEPGENKPVEKEGSTTSMRKRRCKPGKLPNPKAFLAVRWDQDSSAVEAFPLFSFQYKRR